MSPDAPFQSILFLRPLSLDELDEAVEPEHFADLFLDQAIERICAGHRGAHLEPYFWTPLRDADEVVYRQDAMRELERSAVAGAVRAFVHSFREVRQQQSLRSQVRYRLRRERCQLDAATAYCAAVTRLAHDLGSLELRSQALRGLRTSIGEHVGSDAFRQFASDAARARQAVESVTYLLNIRGNRIQVRRPEDEPDLGHEVAELFARFRQHGKPGDPVIWSSTDGFSHVEAQVLEQVAAVFPDEFAQLAMFNEQHERFVDTTVSRFARDAVFALAFLDFKAHLADHGLPMCFPAVASRPGLRAEGCFDLALAANTHGGLPDDHPGPSPLVRNALSLVDEERVIVVTGPNQGGKTTVARAFGQIHYLASLGCPVPAEDAEVFLPDRVFVQFERQEDPGSHRGKLKDDLIRMKSTLESATRRSVIVLNEVFSSTTTDDAVQLAERALGRILDLGCLCLCVTFLDELASCRPHIVSMVAEVDAHDPGKRTYRVTRRPADGRAYAESIAAKYRLTGPEIKERIRR